MITTCFILASAVLIAAAFLAILLSGHNPAGGKFLRPANVLLIGVFISGVLLFLPIYSRIFSSNLGGIFETLIISVHHVLRLFVLDGEFDFIISFTQGLSGWLRTVFPILAATLYVLAPILTFGFILSFFKSLAAYRRYLRSYFFDTYVFSDLNPRSLALAKDLRKNHPKCMLLFADVFEQQDEHSHELLEQAKVIRAICFRDDITAIDYSLHSKHSKLYFFLIGPDSDENITQTLSLIEMYRNRDNTRIYTFSTSIEGELLVRQPAEGKIRVHRVDEVRTLIYRMMYDGGQFLFEDAQVIDGVKTICAVIVGLGKRGTEMLRTLPWLCQMTGYRLIIHAFDRDPLAESRFRNLCPELMAEDKNGTHIEGEPEYSIHIHSGIEVHTSVFSEMIGHISLPTYIFVSLGDDEQNIETAVALRIMAERMHVNPRIQAVVYSSQKRNALDGVCNFKGQPYRIEFLGDLESEYAEKVIIHSSMEKDALQRHLKWGAEDDFWRFEYNYRSSIATAIHMRMREACQMPWAGKKEDELTAEDRDALEQLEHKRWNAYMRCEGYIFSGSLDRTSRNDLGKMHPNLVPFEQLEEDIKRKDSQVGSE